MSIRVLRDKAVSNREIARTLGVSEGTVRYHGRRDAQRAVDGRSRQVHKAAAFRPAIDAWLAAGRLEAPDNITALYEWLVAEHDYPGSLRSVQRYVRAAFPAPPRRARRRVETPPGAQAQADWGHFPGVWMGGRQRDLLAFEMTLSYSRFDAVIWSERKDLLSWLAVHNAAFAFLGGVPATVRVDNEKTAVVRGSGVWGELHPVYRRYAQSLRFHPDVCAPRCPERKGKVERKIRTLRGSPLPYRNHWADLAELQAATDERLLAQARRRRCPATGQSVFETWQAERAALSPIDHLPEPFDVVVTRTVGADCMVRFEGRSYSVPFAWLGRAVEVRGGAREVQIFAGHQCLARHPRGTEQRILIDPSHYEGPSTDAVLAPMPLGRMGRKLAEIAALAPEQRPLDLYAALAEVAQ